MSNTITAWFDEEKRKKVLKDMNDVYYYMIYADTPAERAKWAGVYIDWVLKDE